MLGQAPKMHDTLACTAQRGAADAVSVCVCVCVGGRAVGKRAVRPCAPARMRCKSTHKHKHPRQGVHECVTASIASKCKKGTWERSGCGRGSGRVEKGGAPHQAREVDSLRPQRQERSHARPGQVRTTGARHATRGRRDVWGSAQRPHQLRAGRRVLAFAAASSEPPFARRDAPRLCCDDSASHCSATRWSGGGGGGGASRQSAVRERVQGEAQTLRPLRSAQGHTTPRGGTPR